MWKVRKKRSSFVCALLRLTVPDSFFTDGKDPMLGRGVGLRLQRLSESLGDSFLECALLGIKGFSDLASGSEDELFYGTSSEAPWGGRAPAWPPAAAPAGLSAVGGLDGGMFHSIDGGWMDQLAFLEDSLTRLSLEWCSGSGTPRVLGRYTNVKELRIRREWGQGTLHG